MTHVSRLDYLGVSVRNLDPEVRGEVRAWRQAVVAHTREIDPLERAITSSKVQYGLWLCGERGAGTSYIGKLLAGRMCFQEGLLDVERVTAHELIQHTRDVWSLDELMRRNDSDMGVYNDAMSAQGTLDRYFEVCDLLWIDDFHHEYFNMPFWKKHVQPYIERRVKHKLPTIVCTTMSPDDDAVPKRVIEDLFTIVICDGYRPEQDGYDYERFRGEG